MYHPKSNRPCGLGRADPSTTRPVKLPPFDEARPVSSIRFKCLYMLLHDFCSGDLEDARSLLMWERRHRAVQLLRQDVLRPVQVTMRLIATRTGDRATVAFLAYSTDRTCLCRVRLIDLVRLHAMGFRFVSEVCHELAERPVRELLVRLLVTLLFRVPLDTFDIADIDVRHLLFDAPVHELACRLVQGVLQLTVALRADEPFRLLESLPSLGALLALGLEALQFAQPLVAETMDAPHLATADEDGLPMLGEGGDAVNLAQIDPDRAVGYILVWCRVIVIRDRQIVFGVKAQLDLSHMRRVDRDAGRLDLECRKPLPAVVAHAEQERVAFDTERLVHPFGVVEPAVPVREPCLLVSLLAVSEDAVTGGQVLVHDRLDGLAVLFDEPFRLLLQIRLVRPLAGRGIMFFGKSERLVPDHSRPDVEAVERLL